MEVDNVLGIKSYDKGKHFVIEFVNDNCDARDIIVDRETLKKLKELINKKKL